MLTTPLSDQLERLSDVSARLIADNQIDDLCKVTDKILELTRELNKKRLLTKEEAIQYLGFTPTAFSNLVRDKRIKCVRPSGHKGMSYYSIKALDEFIIQQEEKSLIFEEDEKNLATSGSYRLVT